MNYCSKCGNLNNEEHKFCTKCGTKIEEQVEEEIIVNDLQSNQNKKENIPNYNKIGGFLIFIGIILVLGLLGTVTFFNENYTKEYYELLATLYESNNELFTLLNISYYLTVICLFFLILLNISFFRKSNITKKLAIIYFTLLIITDIYGLFIFSDNKEIMLKLSVEIIKISFQIVIALLFIIYFSISKRVKETFIEEKNFGLHVVIASIVPIILFYYYSDKLNEIKLNVSSSDNKIIESKNTIKETSYTNENIKLMFMINTETDKFGLIDKNAKWIVEPIFDNVGDFKEDLARVKINNKWGFIDRKGNFVIQPIYDSADVFSEGVAKVDINDKSGFIDRKGNFVIQPIYEYAGDFSEGVAKVRINNRWGFIDRKGNFVIQPIYEFAYPFSEGVAKVKINYKYGFIDRKGKFVIQPIYEYAGDFSEGVATVAIHSKYGFIDRKGNFVIQPIYEYAGDFSEGVAKVDINDKVGLINKKGNWIVKPIFDNSFGYNFKDGFAITYLIDYKTYKRFNYGVIDRNGNQIIPPIYDSMYFFGELIVVKINNKEGLLSREGKWIIQPILDDLMLADDLAMAIKDNKYGLIDKFGNWIIQPTLDKIFYVEDGYLIAIKNQKAGLIDTKGNWIIQPIF